MNADDRLFFYYQITIGGKKIQILFFFKCMEDGEKWAISRRIRKKF